MQSNQSSPSAAFQGRAVRIIDPRGFDGLELRSEPTAACGRRDVVIRVHAASLNYRDLVIAYGRYPGALRPQPIPLSDGAGRVVAVGSDVTQVRIGDRVTSNCYVDWTGGSFRGVYHMNSVGMTVDGMLAEYAVLPETGIIKLPDYLSFEEAASLPCAAVSAWSALNVGEPLSPGQTVLIQGTGGVALFGLQIARMYGAKVLAITSSAAKAKILEDMGAAAVVNYKDTPNWSEAILALTHGVGVDKVVEIGGESTIQQSVASTRMGGQIGLVGFVTGFGGGLPPIAILQRSVTIMGMVIGPRISFETLLAAMELHRVRPVVDSVFPFEDYKAAYRHLESANHIGKIVVRVNGDS